jgi:NitT/TauT family transport system ATP-binding protein
VHGPPLIIVFEFSDESWVKSESVSEPREARGVVAQDNEPASAAPHLILDEVVKTYPMKSGRVEVLRGMGARLRRGEFVSIVGPSGCGKSTFLKIAAGLIAPDAGTVLLDGRRAQAGRRDVGILLQNPSLLPWRTVFNNVLLPYTIFREVTKQTKADVAEALEMVGLQRFADAYPWQLSGGMQQRAALARLFAYRPAIQLMDEPFGALDEITRERLNIELARLHEKGGETVLLVTHGIQEAVLLSDRALVMTPRPGRLVGEVVIDLPRPRHAAMVDSPDFADKCKHVRSLLQHGSVN